MFKKHEWLLLLLVFLVGVSVVIIIENDRRESVTQPVADVLDETTESENPPEKISLHVSVPDEVRGIYWTASTAGSSRSEELITYMKETGLNTVVIDLKMDDGELAFIPNNVELVPFQPSTPAISELDTLLERLRQEGIYRVARIAVMRDGAFARKHPDLAMQSVHGGLWQDRIGSYWVDPASTEVSSYAIALASEAYMRGFDEVQFDYVRFASDGSVNQILYPVYDGTESKQKVMAHFFERVGGQMKKEGIPVSFDLFGMTFWSYTDFNIGQRLVDVLSYTDWVSPMVYPSHYPDGFEGFANPAEAPYEIVKRSLDEGTRLTRGFWSGTEIELQSKWRPWLQDFDIGAVYTSAMIEAQIQAARDAGASGWILWNARNVYERANYR